MDIYIYTYIYVYVYIRLIIIYCCILTLRTCCTFIHVHDAHVKHTFNVSSGRSYHILSICKYVQNIKLDCVTLLFWTLKRNNRVVALALEHLWHSIIVVS